MAPRREPGEQITAIRTASAPLVVALRLPMVDLGCAAKRLVLRPFGAKNDRPAIMASSGTSRRDGVVRPSEVRDPAPRAPLSSAVVWHCVAAIAYLAVGLWTLRVVLWSPSELLPTEIRAQPQIAQLVRLDQSMVMSVVVRNADTLLRAPAQLLEFGQCFPLRRSHTLGEHMFGTGLLAAVPYLLSGDPILTYNAVLLLSIWIAGLTMYAFVFDLVRRPGPAFVAGLLFALTPDRVWDMVHPYVHGDHWAPLAALFLRRLVVHGGALPALGAALFCALSLLESFYAVVASGIVLGTYGIHLAWTHRARLLRRLPLLTLVLAVLAAVGWLVFAPYLETRELLGVLRGRDARLRSWWMIPLMQVAVVLAAISIVDRLRGPRARDGDDPRWAFLVAALVSLWFSAGGISRFGIGIPSPVVLLSGVVPGFDAVRAPGAIGLGAWFAVAVLAGFGMLALTERLTVFGRAVATLAAALVIFSERNVPALSQLLLRQDLRLVAWHARPPEEQLRLLRATRGPILYLPIAYSGAKALQSADYLRLTSFSSRPTSACYNSFGSPLTRQIAKLGEALPDAAAADALYAFGFRTIVVDRSALWPAAAARFEDRIVHERRPRLVPAGRTERLSAFVLNGEPATRRDLSALAPRRRAEAGYGVGQIAGAGTRTKLDFGIVNRSRHTFVHPEPLLPSEVVVRWTAARKTVAAERLRVLLPLALASNAQHALSAEVSAPTTRGTYQVTLEPVSAKGRVIAAETIEVR